VEKEKKGGWGGGLHLALNMADLSSSEHCKWVALEAEEGGREEGGVLWRRRRKEGGEEGCTTSVCLISLPFLFRSHLPRDASPRIKLISTLLLLAILPLPPPPLPPLSLPSFKGASPSLAGTQGPTLMLA
jgi:hypothetical protein